MQDGKTGPVMATDPLVGSNKVLCIGGWPNPSKVAQAVDKHHTSRRYGIVCYRLQKDAVRSDKLPSSSRMILRQLPSPPARKHAGKLWSERMNTTGSC